MALLLNRNVLIEDVTGMEKTTLVKFMARVLNLDFRRMRQRYYGCFFNKSSKSFSYQ